MKKLLSLILVMALVLGLCACAPAGSDSTDGSNAADTTAAGSGTLMVGYGKADITPLESVPLMGYGTTEKRMSTGFVSYLYQVALAITDSNGNTAIVIAADACWFDSSTAKEIRKEIENELGVPADNIIISACHQHSAPDMFNSNAPSGKTYKEEVFIPGAVAAAKAAMENRAHATVQTTSVETENMNFVRQYIMEDGSYAGDNYGNWDLKIVAHETEVDNELRLVKFIREGQTTENGKEAKDIILTNFQGHPHRGASSNFYNAHSDMIGIYRDELEEELDCQVIYFSGAGGNVNMSSRIESENITADYKAQAKALVKYAVEAEGTYTDIDCDDVKATKMSFEATYNHSEDHRVAEATEAYNEWLNTGKTTLIEKYGFNSQYHAKYVIAKAKLGTSYKFEIFALSFGDIGFVGAPYEMFDTNGMEIKEGSPFEVTIVSTIANGGEGYIPSQLGYDHGGYSVDTSYLVPGTGEQLRDAYLSMLNELHGE